MGLGYLEALRPQPHADVGTPAQTAPHRSAGLHRGFPCTHCSATGPGAEHRADGAPECANSAAPACPRTALTLWLSIPSTAAQHPPLPGAHHRAQITPPQLPHCAPQSPLPLPWALLEALLLPPVCSPPGFSLNRVKATPRKTCLTASKSKPPPVRVPEQRPFNAAKM